MLKLLKKAQLIYALFFIISPLSCLDDSGETGGKGVLNVTVNVDTAVWGYPEQTGSDFIAFDGDTTHLWCYSEVGGDGLPGGDGEENLSADPIAYDVSGYPIDYEIGDKNIIVYLYSQLGDNAKAYAVLYKGTTDVNGGIVTIGKIAAGSYYIVAFYDYCAGGNQENLLNRYDRYSIYTETDPIESTANSTVYYDKATAIEITDNTPVNITLVIKKNWVLGKPKTDTSSQAGRKFLVFEESIPTP